jgi:hypothetical protein
MRLATIVLLSFLLLTACVNMPENYKPAGFESADEAREYVKDYLYYAKKLTTKEWDEFYERFPAYWKDKQTAKTMGSTLEYHPWYTAYAFRWNTLRRMKDWDPATVVRLQQKEIVAGDDIFQVVYAIGPAIRVVWDNDFEVLAYPTGTALLFKKGIYERSAQCIGCDVRFNAGSREGMQDADVISTLNLSRPRY